MLKEESGKMARFKVRMLDARRRTHEAQLFFCIPSVRHGAIYLI